jgi:ubiquitin C-terminal hydrolase
MIFWNLPDILVIDLKRYNSQNMKNTSFVQFPLEDLDLSSYVIGYNNSSYKYNLYAVSNHFGNPMGGHYTSFVKNANGYWYHFDDGTIQKVLDAKIRREEQQKRIDSILERINKLKELVSG